MVFLQVESRNFVQICCFFKQNYQLKSLLHVPERTILKYKLILFRYMDNNSQFCRKTFMEFYHIYTKGLEDKIIFRDSQDYIAGMNYVAIAQYKTKVRILAFVLMSNHFHFAVCASVADALAFINLFKRLISVYIMNRYGENAYLRRMITSCDPIPTSDDNLKRLIAYILDNPVKAGVNCVAFAYQWGSASCYFSSAVSESTPVSSMNTRVQRNLLRSNVLLPDSYLLGNQGYILPHSYIDIKFVEMLFSRPKSLEYYLSISASSRKIKRDTVVFSDEIVSKAMRELLSNKYGAASLHDLDVELQKNLARELRTYFNASAKQIARITGMHLKDAIAYLS